MADSCSAPYHVSRRPRVPEDRVHHGIVAEIAAKATANHDAQRTYFIELRSACEWLSLVRNPRIFRKKTAVAIVTEVLSGVGLTADQVSTEIAEAPPEREHVTVWDESDASFLRRVCEEDGLYFRFDPRDGFDAFVLCDRSSSAPDGLDAPLRFADGAALRRAGWTAHHAVHTRRRRPGKVTVRDFDHARPSLALEGEEKAR